MIAAQLQPSASWSSFARRSFGIRPSLRMLAPVFRAIASRDIFQEVHQRPQTADRCHCGCLNAAEQRSAYRPHCSPPVLGCDISHDLAKPFAPSTAALENHMPSCAAISAPSFDGPRTAVIAARPSPGQPSVVAIPLLRQGMATGRRIRQSLTRLTICESGSTWPRGTGGTVSVNRWFARFIATKSASLALPNKTVLRR